MSEMNEPQNNDAPLFPPQLLLLVGLVGLLVLLFTLFAQGSMTALAWAALGVTALSLAGWVITAPRQALDFVTGRSVTYGGVSVVVTLVFIAALVAVYVLVRGQSWQLDLTEADTFSLSDEARLAIETLAADPTVPSIRILAFYTVDQAGLRDQHTLLFDAYVTASDGKISYEYVDPERNPVVRDTYAVTQGGQIVIVTLDAEGNPLPEDAELVASFNQEAITNAILRTAAQGDFRAYVLSVQGGATLDDAELTGLTELRSVLVDGLSWTVEAASVLDIATGTVNLNDAAADATLLLVVGGSSALPDDERQMIQDFLDGGGKAVILAAPPAQADQPSLATDPALNAYLADTFGVSFGDGLIVDNEQALRSPLIPAATDFGTHPINDLFGQVGQPALVVANAAPIVIAQSAPENVTVTALARTSDVSYTRSISQITAQELAQAEGDPVGPFPVAVAAENTATGARLVLFSSTRPALNWSSINSGTGIVNFEMLLGSVFWTTGFDTFFTGIQQVQRALTVQETTPLLADDATLSSISTLTVLVIPFSILFAGVAVWLARRQGTAAA